MKVLSLQTQEAFEEACQQLASLTFKYKPSIVIGIKSGGVYVAEEIRKMYASDVIYDSIRIQRRSSGGIKKNKYFGALISILPKWMIKILRIAEMQLSEFSSSFKKPVREVEFKLKSTTQNAIKNGANILLVDDAIDTGTTMKLAIEKFISMNSANTVKVAVITVTHKSPKVKPNYCLYTRTVVQFPWSLDNQ